MATIEIWTYDVWGNDEDGYDVNDRCKIGEYETDLTELSAKEIESIVSEYFLHPENISIDDNVMCENPVYLVLNDKEHTDYPLGEIYLNPN
jgi:hypothetical protein